MGTQEASHIDNNKIIAYNAIVVSSIVFVMFLVFIFMVCRRNRNRDEARRSARQSKNLRQHDYSTSNTTRNDESQSSYRQNENSNEENRKNSARTPMNEFDEVEVEELPSSSGQYHFSFRELEFLESSNDNQQRFDEKEIDSELKRIDEERDGNLNELDEEDSDSDYDATFETTVES